MNASRLWTRFKQRLGALRGEEAGQVLPMVCVSMLAMLGMVAFAIDLGRAMYCSRELQATTDAAALAAAQAMPTAATLNAITGTNGVAYLYSAAPGGYNQRSSLPSVTVSATTECLNTLKSQGIACSGAVPYNAVQVTQTSTLNTYFGAVIGVKTVALSATATAATRGGSPRPSNVAVVIDTTLSMNEYDANCAQTEMQCALNGFQILLKSLQPCAQYQTSCNDVGNNATNSFDRVALFTFPNLTTSTAAIDSSCTTPIPSSLSGVWNDPPYGLVTVQPNLAWSGIPTAAPYTYPSATATSYSPSGTTYQVTSFMSDYRTSVATTSLNPSSPLVKASGAVSGCGSMTPSNYDGGYGTYYAGAIYAAQAALLAEQALNPGSENVLIILGDGDSNSPQTWSGYPAMPSPANNSGTYPSYVNECKQAVTAAQSATAAGTLVYTVAYGASAVTGCSTDTLSSIYYNNPCDAMAAMASAPQNFYSDWQQTASDGTCTSSQPVTSLNSIFSAIAADLTEARLIPNNTT